MTQQQQAILADIVKAATDRGIHGAALAQMVADAIAAFERQNARAA